MSQPEDALFLLVERNKLQAENTALRARVERLEGVLDDLCHGSLSHLLPASVEAALLAGKETD